MADVLLVFHRPASFVQLDAEILRERWSVEEWRQAHPLARPLALARAVRRSRVVVGWFASWHTLLPVLLARLLRRPSLVIVGGFDLARLPEIGYGNQRGGLRRWATRGVLVLATRLLTNSRFSLEELTLNAGVPAERAEVVYHGVPDPFGDLPEGPRETLVLTIGVIDERNLERKGLRLFVESAAELPDVEFVLAGRWDGAAADALKATATPNVFFAGWVPDEELRALLTRASVYVQASRHEGFGMAVAEAMLAGCIPVVTRAGALPEVVGDVGVVVDAEPTAVAAGVRQALASGRERRQRARARVLHRFPLDVRRAGLHRIVAELIAATARAPAP